MEVVGVEAPPPPPGCSVWGLARSLAPQVVLGVDVQMAASGSPLRLVCRAFSPELCCPFHRFSLCVWR